MKIQTLVLGEYGSPPAPFCLYLFPVPLTPPLCSPATAVAPITHKDSASAHFYCLEDLDALFFTNVEVSGLLSDMLHHRPACFCKDQATSRLYIMTRAVADIAAQLRLDTLAALCNSTEHDFTSGTAHAILRRITGLSPATTCTMVEQNFVPARVTPHHESVRVKQEPQSPVIRLSPPADDMDIERPCTRFDPCRDNDTSANRLSIHSSSKSASPPTVASSTEPTPVSEPTAQPKPSSLLLKRLAPKSGQLSKTPPHLTIFTPSYAGTQGTSNGIQSAPLRPRMAKPLQPNHTHANKVVKRSHLRPPATAAALWEKRSEFPSPPIVPSQQHYAVSRQDAHAKTPALPVCTPAPPTGNNLRKQQFLQPFEVLYDTIEQTRQLKGSLDDQIRRSATLIQGLQSSSTVVETMVRQQVRDMMQQAWDPLQACAERVSRLESRATPPADQPDSLKHALSQLMERLDRLEKKLDTRH